MTGIFGINIFGHGINGSKSSSSTGSKIGSTTASDVALIRNNIDMITLSDSVIDVNRNSIVNLAASTQTSSAVNKLYVDTENAQKLNKSGDSMTGNLNMNNNKICNVSIPVEIGDAANKFYVDTTAVKKSGDSMTGHLDMNSHEIFHVRSPTDELSATNKTYVDNKIDSVVAETDYIFTDKVPSVDLTSNSMPAPFWCSCDNYSNTAWHAFSSSANSDWVIGNVTEGWILVHSPDSFCAKRLTIKGSSTLTGSVTKWKFMGTSSDDIWTENVWDILIECDGENEIKSNSSFDVILSSNTKKHRYFKLTIEAGTLPVGINHIGIYNGVNTLNIHGDNKMVGNLDINGHRVVNIGDPLAENDAINKQYVDARFISYSDNAPLPGFTFRGKQVHRYFHTATFTNETVVLISNASALIRYEGQIELNNQTCDIRIINSRISGESNVIGAVYFSGTWMTSGGNISLLGNSGLSNFQGSNYWIMIEYTVD